MSDIDEFLDGEPETGGEEAQTTESTEGAQAAPEAEPAPESAPDTPEKPEDGATAEKTDAPAASEEKHVPLAALQDERQKRQALERQFEAFRQEVTQAHQRETPKPPDMFEDPEGYLRHMEQSFDEKLISRVMGMAEAQSRATHGDFDEALAAFGDAVRANPVLSHQLRQAAHPGEFAYQVGKQALMMREIGDPEAFGQKRFDAGYEKAKAEFEPRLKELEAKLTEQAAPPNLGGERSAGDRSGPAWAGPESLEEMFPSV